MDKKCIIKFKNKNSLTCERGDPYTPIIRHTKMANNILMLPKQNKIFTFSFKQNKKTS